MVCCYQAKSVIPCIFVKSSRNHSQSLLQREQRHLAINIQNIPRDRCGPTQKRLPPCNGQTDAQTQPRFSYSSRRIEHRQTSFWQNGIEQHLARRNLQPQEFSQSNRRERLLDRSARLRCHVRLTTRKE